MRLSVLAATIATLVAADVVLAQPRPMLRPTRGPTRDAGQGKDDKNRGRGNAYGHDKKRQDDNAQLCEARRTLVSTEQKRYEAYQSDLAGIEAEIAALERRLEDLRRQRKDVQRNLTVAEKRYKKADEIYKRDCQASETCHTYEASASQLDAQTRQLEAELDLVRSEMTASRDATTRLEQRIQPLQREYSEKRCNNLVAGETQQSVIDRCAAIFSEWNRLQADLNRQNNRVFDLRSRYEQLFAELRALERRASTYESYLTRNCSSSSQVTVVRNYSRHRQRAEAIGNDLNRLLSDIARLRGVKITVTAH